MSILVLMAVGLLAAFQPSTPRVLIGGALYCVFVFFYWVDPYLSDLSYYVIAGLLDLLLVYVIGGVRPITLSAIKLQRLCTASLIINTAGLILWWHYVDPWYYNAAMFAVHASILIAMSGDDGHGDSTIYSVCYPVRFNYRSGYIRMQNDEKTV